MRELSQEPLKWAKRYSAVIVALMLVMGIASLTAHAGTVHNTGEDRYTLLNGDIADADGNWSANIQLNLSVPEEIGTRSSLDGTITYNMSQSVEGNLSDVSPAFYVNTTVSVQGETVYANETLDFSENETEYEKDITVDLADADLNESDDTNDTMTVDFTTESNTNDSGGSLSTSDSISLEVKLVEQVSYMVSSMVVLMIDLIPLIVVVFIMIIIINVLTDVFEDIEF